MHYFIRKNCIRHFASRIRFYLIWKFRFDIEYIYSKGTAADRAIFEMLLKGNDEMDLGKVEENSYLTINVFIFM